MAHKKSSKHWLNEHFSDPYVLRSQREGFRGRAVYKLKEIDQKYSLLKPGKTVLDLGAAPGSWAQLAARKVGTSGAVIASDILQMEPIDGVRIITGDFREETILRQILRLMGDCSADLVLSDMAPNMSGMASIDQPASMYLAELALDICGSVLRPDGALLVKLFQGEGVDDYFTALRSSFSQVTVCKPQASRPRSRELYALARGHKV